MICNFKQDQRQASDVRCFTQNVLVQQACWTAGGLLLKAQFRTQRNNSNITAISHARGLFRQRHQLQHNCHPLSHNSYWLQPRWLMPFFSQLAYSSVCANC